MKVMYKYGSGLQLVPEWNPRRVLWKKEDQERFLRSEYNAVKALLIVKCFLGDSRKDLRNRLACIPYGNERMNMAYGALDALLEDLLGTTTEAQRNQLMNTRLDYQVCLVPKHTPMCNDVVMDLETAKCLTDCAQEKCIGCTEDGESCRNCKLYQIMEATTPLENYGNGMLCPYNMVQWEE